MRVESRQHREAADAAKQELETLKNAQTEAENNLLTEQEQYRELAENYKGQLEAMQQQMLQQQHNALVSSIANEFNLPKELSIIIFSSSKLIAFNRVVLASLYFCNFKKHKPSVFNVIAFLSSIFKI